LLEPDAGKLASPVLRGIGDGNIPRLPDYLEDLNIKGMMANHKLAKHIADAGWGTFVRMLEYKAEWNDKRVFKIGRFYPSSKTCHECGYINQDLTLSERDWTCLNGHHLDRELNASITTLDEGLRIMEAESPYYTGGS